MDWARRSRRKPFKRLSATLKKHFDAVVRRMQDNRAIGYMVALNGAAGQARRTRIPHR